MWPDSCCYEDNDHDHAQRADNELPKEDPYCQGQSTGVYVYSSGCFAKMKTKIEANAKVLIGVGIGIAFVEVSF